MYIAGCAFSRAVRGGDGRCTKLVACHQTIADGCNAWIADGPCGVHRGGTIFISGNHRAFPDFYRNGRVINLKSSCRRSRNSGNILRKSSSPTVKCETERQKQSEYFFQLGSSFKAATPRTRAAGTTLRTDESCLHVFLNGSFNRISPFFWLAGPHPARNFMQNPADFYMVFVFDYMGIPELCQVHRGDMQIWERIEKHRGKMA